MFNVTKTTDASDKRIVVFRLVAKDHGKPTVETKNSVDPFATCG